MRLTYGRSLAYVTQGTRFRGEDSSSPPVPQAEKASEKGFFQGLYDKFNYGMVLTTLVTKVTGSLMLLASLVIPGSGKTDETLHTAKPSPEQTVAATKPVLSSKMMPEVKRVDVAVDTGMQTQLDALKDLLKSLGLGTITVGIFTGSVGEVGVGIKQKQPTVALVSAAFLAATPLFYYDNSFTRGLYLTLLGAYYSGYANVIRNKFQQPGPEKPIETEVTFQNLPQVTEHVIGDQLRVLSAVPRTPEMLKNVVTDTIQALQALKDGKPLEIAPHSDRVMLSALGHFAGGTMLMLAGADPMLALAGSTIASVSSLSSNLEWFAIGTQRKDWVGTALKAGVPLCVLGKTMFFTNVGYGAEKLGQGLTFAMSLDLVEDKKPGAEASVKKDDSPPHH